MRGVDIGDQDDGCHEEQEHMTKDEVRSEEAHLGHLTKQLTAGLGHRVQTQSVPFPGPEGDVASISLELSSECKVDNELVEPSLDGDDGDHAQKRLREAESLEEKHNLEEGKEHDDSHGVGNGGKDRPKLLATHTEQRAHTTSHPEEHGTDTEVHSHWGKGDHANTNNRSSWQQVLVSHLLVAVVFLSQSSLRVDEQVRNQGDENQNERSDNLVEDGVAELGTRDIAGELLGRVSQSLTLVTGDTGSRQAAESDPRLAMRAGVSARQPAKVVTVVDKEVVPGELMRVVNERRDTKGKQRNPEVNQSRLPDRTGGKQQHQQRSGSKIDRRAGETRVQDTVRNTGSCETTSSSNVPGTTVGHVLKQRIGIHLTDEHLKQERERAEMLRQTSSRAPESTFRQLLNHQGHKRYKEYNKDGKDATGDPVEDWHNVAATDRQHLVSDRDIGVVVADDDLVLQGTNVDQDEHETLHRQDDEDVVNVEAGVRVVEGQESIERKLRAEIVVFARQELLSHTSTDLCGEVQNGSKPHITSLTTLVVLAVLDTTSTYKRVHAGVNILVQMKSLLSLGNTTTGRHEDTVQEIRMSVMQFTADLGQSTSKKSSECLFLSGSNITKDTDVLRENVFTSSQDGNRREVGGRQSRGVRRNVVDGHLLKFSQNTANLEALFQVVVLVGIDELDVLSTVENDSVVLIVGFTVTENGVSGKHHPELGTTRAALHKLRVSVDQSREEAGFASFFRRGFLVKVCYLKVGVRTQQELRILHFLLLELSVTLHRDTDLVLPASHPLEFPLQLVGVSTEHLDNLGILNTVEKLNGTAVVHESGDGTVQGLRPKRRPDTCAEGVLWLRRLESDTVEGQIVGLGLRGILFVLLGVFAGESRRLISQNLGILDEAVPLVRVQLL